jgi:hypothetical protein
MSEQFKKKMEQREAREREEIEKSAKLFDPKLLAQETDKKHSVTDDEGNVIYYFPLRIDESLEIGKMADDTQRSLEILFRMLHKAYPELTREEVHKFPMIKGARLLELMTTAQGFRGPK